MKRYRSAVESLDEWHEVLKNRCEFTCLDWHAFLQKCHDRDGHCIYADPPWLDAGRAYRHTFTDADHIDLSKHLHLYQKTKVVIRHSDVPLYRELYGDWKWTHIGGRNRANKEVNEWMIVNASS